MSRTFYDSYIESRYSDMNRLENGDDESLNNLRCCVDKMKATQPQSKFDMFRNCSVLFVFLRFVALSREVFLLLAKTHTIKSCSSLADVHNYLT